MKLAPIALFAYKRPVHVRRAIEAILGNPEAVHSDLYIFSDGPKSARDEAAVQSVRGELRNIRGFKSVNIIEREKNLGLRASVVDGITRLTEAHDRVIVIEDDLVVSPDFLNFMNAGLERYAQEARVYSISGYMYPIELTGLEDSLFLPMTSCWGWATWKRAWRQFDPSLSGVRSLERDRSLRQKFNLDGAYNYYSMIRQQSKGKIDSWGICWHLSVFLKDGLTLYPRQSLVENLGVDGSGTHNTSGGGNDHSVLHPRLEVGTSASEMLHLPDSIQVNQVAYGRVTHLLRCMRPSIARRFLNWMQS